MSQKEFYTVNEVAATLAISNDTVRRLLSDGKLPGIRVSARIWRIPIKDFEKWLENGHPARDGGTL